jgi:transcriptional regulator with XRE-family HTH domain
MSNENIDNQILIGKRLRAFRLENGLKSNELAEICNISQGSISGLENGKSYPSAETLINLINNTDIDICYLLTGKKIKHKSKIRFLLDIEEWIEEEIEKDAKRKDWFEIQFQELFQGFKEWKLKKEGNEDNLSEGPSLKIA